MRYPVPDALGANLFQDLGYAGDVAVSTPNTTVFLQTTMPNWLLLEYQEMAEFAASLTPVFEAQRQILAKSRTRARTRRRCRSLKRR